MGVARYLVDKSAFARLHLPAVREELEPLMERGLVGMCSPDLLVAATGRAHDLEILHYDRDFDTIARHTEQPVRWIVPAGSAESKPEPSS